jgi:hypothetical protein
MAIDIQAQIQAQIAAAIARAQAAARAAAEAAAKAAAEAAAKAAAQAAQTAAKVQKPVDAIAQNLRKDVFDGAKQAASLATAPLKIATSVAKFTQQAGDLASDAGALGRATKAFSGVASFVSLPSKAVDLFSAAQKVTQQPLDGQAWANLCSKGFGVAATAYQGAASITTALDAAKGVQSLTDLAAPVENALHLTGPDGLVAGFQKAGQQVLADGKSLLSDGKSILSSIGDASKGVVGAVAGKVAGAAGTEAGEKVAEKVAISAGGEAAARFVPGLNIAVAANDTYAAYQTWNDPNASDTKKACAITTAAGDWMAASDVPVVSQVGAVVATASSVIGAIWG